MPNPNPVILWFRQNLRLSDNAALVWAAKQGPLIPLFIHEDGKLNPFPYGGASRWWLNEALLDLQDSLIKQGLKLVLRRGNPADILPELAKETGATSVAWQRRYEPFFKERDAKLVDVLGKHGVECSIHEGYLLFEPGSILNGSGKPYKVYTPFSRACFSAPTQPPTQKMPTKLVGIDGIRGDQLKDWKLVPPNAKWPAGLAKAWTPGEPAARKHLQAFIDKALAGYKTGRDRPDKPGTSRLSPYLHFGNISPRQVWNAVHFALGKNPSIGNGAECYLREILWREFSWHLLSHVPTLPTKPLDTIFAEFPWKKDAAGLRAWQKGLTGYPIVDAGMRQLWETGWMHNRVRMIVASFLIKDLLIPWQQGAEWFWDTLVDADLGNNSASWQWVAGCGADAAPYYRVFNPTLQGKKFDPDGAYVRRFVPELANLDTRYIHEPWEAPEAVLLKAKIALGRDYPLPILDHGKARQRALEAYKELPSRKDA